MSALEAPVFVLGAGGHGKVVVSVLQAAGLRIAGILDDDPVKMGLRVLGVPVVGPVEELAGSGVRRAVVALGDNRMRSEMAARFPRVEWVSVTHPGAYVHPSARIGEGTVIFAGAIVQPDCAIGAHVIVNTGATIDHDGRLADHVHVAPGSHLAGGVELGPGAFIGPGATVAANARVGGWTRVGAGSVVIDDLPEDVLAVGVPARPTARARIDAAARGGGAPGNAGAGEAPEGNTLQMASADIGESDVESVVEVLRSGRLALGPKTEAFEARLREYVGAKHAVAVSSGTAALHLIVKSLGIRSGDEVIVPSFTFAASVNVLLHEGAVPVFADIEPETFNLNPDDVARKVTSRTRAILAVDVFGHPAEWDTILEVAASRDLQVIDDSCEALGARYRDRPLGQLADAAAFAFYPNKQITTGEGGMLVTSDDEVAGLARSLRNQGRGAMGAWLEHERLGYNYRMDEMSAALGISQLGRLEEFLVKRDRVASWYGSRLESCEHVRPPIVKPHVRMSWFVYVVLLSPGADRDAVIRFLQGRGIPVRAYFTPVHQQPYMRSHDSAAVDLPVTESVARRTLALPFHNNLSEHDVDRVVDLLREAVRRVA